MTSDSVPQRIVNAFKHLLTGERYAALPMPSQWRITVTSVVLGIVAAMIVLLEGHRWLAIPIALFFFLTGIWFGVDAQPLLRLLKRGPRRVARPASEERPPVIAERMIEALLTPADVDEGWERLPPYRNAGLIAVPCSSFSILGSAEIDDTVVVELQPHISPPGAEGVRQTIVVAIDADLAARRFKAAQAAFGCGQWSISGTDYDVDRIDVPTGDAEAVAYRLYSHPLRQDSDPPWIIYGVVIRNGRVLTEIRLGRRSTEPDIAMMRRMTSRAVDKVARLALALPDLETVAGPAATVLNYVDLEPFFPTDDIPESFVLEDRRAPSPAPIPDDTFHSSWLVKGAGYRYGEQRLFFTQVDFYCLDMTTGRYVSSEAARDALRADIGQYLKKEYYGVRSIRIPMIGDESAAASGRASGGPDGLRVACIWFRHGAIVARYQGFAHKSDPLPVVQTIVEGIARRTRDIGSDSC